MVEFYCTECREIFETNKVLTVCPECRAALDDWFEEETESHAQI